MAADGAVDRPARSQLPAFVPEQDRRRVALPPAERIVRQVEAVDAWVAARRAREQALHAQRVSRDERMDVAREIEVLRRTHDVIKGRCARALDDDLRPMRAPGLNAVIAHRHAWFADKLALLLGGHGVTVLMCTDNAAEALGAVVAEQPDMVLVGDRLAMMSSHALLAAASLYAPDALLAAQVSAVDQADALQVAADDVFLRHQPPAVIADVLVARFLTTTGAPSRA